MKKIIILLLITFAVVGCTNTTYKKVKLSSIYYNEGNFIDIKASDLKDKETYLLFTYNSYCNFEIPCDEVFLSVMKDLKIDVLKMPFEEFKKTSLYEKVKYAPSIIIVNNNEIIDFLDANKDEDLKYYQNSKEFASWLKERLVIEWY